MKSSGDRVDAMAADRGGFRVNGLFNG